MLDLNNNNNKSLLQNAKLSAKQKLSAHTIHSYYTPEGCSLSTHCHHNNNNNKSICKAQTLVHRDYSKCINQTSPSSIHCPPCGWKRTHLLPCPALFECCAPIIHLMVFLWQKCTHLLPCPALFECCAPIIHLMVFLWRKRTHLLPCPALFECCAPIIHLMVFPLTETYPSVTMSSTVWVLCPYQSPDGFSVTETYPSVTMSSTVWVLCTYHSPDGFSLTETYPSVTMSSTVWVLCPYHSPDGFSSDGNVPICYHVQHCLSAVPLSFTWWFFFDSSILLKWSEASASWTGLCRASEAWRKMKTKRITRNNKTKQKI